MVTDGPPRGDDRLDDVGIERTLGQELDPAERLRLLLEDLDEGGADDLALDFGLLDAGEPRQEERTGVPHDERNVVMAAEDGLDLLPLARAQEAVIDEDAVEPAADRLVDEHGGDGGIDPAREPADDAAPADLGPDARKGLLAEGGHGPIARAARHLAAEIAQEIGAMRGVHDLGMEHHTVEPALVVGGHGKGRPLAHADRAKSLGQPHHAVAMAHPDLLALALAPHPVGDHRLARHLDEGAAEFLVVAQPAPDRPAERTSSACRSRCQHRDAERETDVRGARRRPR